jgi:tripartite-type tricarboxylate transporter receptor subunit TctC
MRTLLAFIVAFAASASFAQGAYPSRPIRMVVGFPPGGIADVLARIVGPEMQKEWGQPVIVDNRAGAGGVIGADFVAKSAPDGYTLLLAPGNHTINAAVLPKLPFDAVASFTPITLLASAPNMLVVRADSPVKNVNDFISMAKAKPGAVTYATSGIATTVHIAGELLANTAGVKLNHIPYKGSAASVTGLLGGDVDASFSAVNAVLPHLKSGRLRGVAVANDVRSAFVPEVPTFTESGVNGVSIGTWLGVLGPADLPRPLAQKLDGFLVALIGRPDIRERILGLGAEPIGMELEKFGALMQNEVAVYTRIARSANIKPE